MPLVLFLVAVLYYAALCAKEYTWVFISSDSGDWLAASNWWLVPQPYGSPLYIMLGHFLNAFPGDLAIKMTIALSVIPSAVTVLLVYLITYKLTSSRSIALVAPCVLLGSAVFLTQSTVLEEYALATMFLTLGFWCYLGKRTYLTAISWGLGASIHVFVLGATLFWLLVEWRRYLKPFLLATTPIVAGFYGFILLLMYLDTPRLFAGGLSYFSLQQYLTTTAGAILGQLSIFEAPKRLLLTIQILLMSFGLAVIPFAKGVSKPITRSTLVMIGIVMWTLWYQVTSLDPAAWTFITYASPFIAIIVGVGLARLSASHANYIIAGALALIIVNASLLNADLLTREKPLARTYAEALWELPDSSIVLTSAGSYSMGLYYVMSEGKDLIPLTYPYLDDWEFRDYATWLQQKHSIDAVNSGTLDVIEDELPYKEIYYADSSWRQSDIRHSLILESTQWSQISRVTGLTGLPPEPFIKEWK